MTLGENMWTHATLTVHIVWEEVLWEARALWQDSLEEPPIVLEKSGRVALPADGSPAAALKAAAEAMTRAADERLG
jgi:hypothetical protein